MSRPETKTAVLVNSAGRATIHRFSHVETLLEPPPMWRGRWTGSADNHVFKCEETGEFRRWGVE